MIPSGGVCAVLDYEIDQMAEYVATQSLGLFYPSTSPRNISPAFRKFVTGLLSSTRLPSTTILLGLTYLSKRARQFCAVSTKFDERQVWHSLTIGLLLGSKFLDDNTFQNRSWSEVSGIKVADLNTMEHEWLEAMDYQLYVNLDTAPYYQKWLEDWEAWRTANNAQRKTTLDRLAPMPLAPIDTNVQRPRQYSQVPKSAGYPKSASRERPHSGYRPYEQTSWAHSYPTPTTTPPSGPNSGLTTPEYMSANSRPYWPEWPVSQAPTYTPYSRAYQPPVHPAYVPNTMSAYPTPYFLAANAFQASNWDQYTDTNCGFFPKQQPVFFHGYGQQIVA